MAEQQQFDPATLTRAAQDTFTVRRVFGEAYERDGVLVIPVARVMGGVGAGSGGGEGTGIPGWVRRGARVADEPATTPADETGTAHGQGHGGGGGYAAEVKPLGVYVVDATGARWEPAVDVNRIVLGVQIVAGVVLSIGLVAKAFHRR